MTPPHLEAAASSPSSSSSYYSARPLSLPRPSSPRAGSRRWRRRPQSIARRSRCASSDLFPELETPPRPSPTAQRGSPTRFRASPTGRRSRCASSDLFPGLETQRRPSPTAHRASTTRLRLSPTGQRSSPTRFLPSPTGRRSSPARPRRHSSVKIRFSKHQLKKYHSFMLCKFDKERAISLAAFIKDKELVRFMVAYGIKPSCDIKGSHRLTRLAQEIIKGVTALVHQILESGYSLRGKLRIKRLYILLETKEIKLVAFRKGVLCRKTNKRAEADWESLERIIRHNILKGQTVPSDAEKFLKLLKDNPNSHQDLIISNVCHMDDICKILYYKWMFEELRQIKRHDSILYQLALTYIKWGLLRWLAEICGSVILEGILNFRDPKVFTPNAEGLTLYGRHSIHHLMDYSVADDGTILFTQADQFNMIEMFLPGFFSEMQEGLYAIKKLETQYAAQEIEKSISEGLFSLATLTLKDQKKGGMRP